MNVCLRERERERERERLCAPILSATHLYRGAFSIAVIAIGNGISNPGSNRG